MAVMARKKSRKGLLRYLKATGSLSKGSDPQRFKLSRGLVDGKGVEGLPKREDLPVKDAPPPPEDEPAKGGMGQPPRKPRIGRTVLPGAGPAEVDEAAGPDEEQERPEAREGDEGRPEEGGKREGGNVEEASESADENGESEDESGEER
jgi:hypothetical protein